MRLISSNSAWGSEHRLPQASWKVAGARLECFTVEHELLWSKQHLLNVEGAALGWSRTFSVVAPMLWNYLLLREVWQAQFAWQAFFKVFLGLFLWNFIDSVVLHCILLWVALVVD